LQRISGNLQAYVASSIPYGNINGGILFLKPQLQPIKNQKKLQPLPWAFTAENASAGLTTFPIVQLPKAFHLLKNMFEHVFPFHHVKMAPDFGIFPSKALYVCSGQVAAESSIELAWKLQIVNGHS